MVYIITLLYAKPQTPVQNDYATKSNEYQQRSGPFVLILQTDIIM